MKMNRMNIISRLLVLLPIALMMLPLVACDTKGGDKMDGMSSEPKDAEEATAMHKELMAQENAIFSENTALWEKVLMAAGKGMAMQEDDKNYGDFLLSAIESAKDQFTAGKLKLTQGGAEKIHDIKDKLAMTEKKYPAATQEPLDGNMSMSAGNDVTMPLDDGSMQKFPVFESRDLDGNTVKSNEPFSGNVVTVVNFWLTTCNPYVGEFAGLDTLNKEFTERGGEIVGINASMLDGNKAVVSEAKDVLPKKGAVYRNVYFPSGGEVGRFTMNVFAYPTTYVVDRNGNIVGDPTVGAITDGAQAEALQVQTDKALSADMG